MQAGQGKPGLRWLDTYLGEFVLDPADKFVMVGYFLDVYSFALFAGETGIETGYIKGGHQFVGFHLCCRDSFGASHGHGYAHFEGDGSSLGFDGLSIAFGFGAVVRHGYFHFFMAYVNHTFLAVNHTDHLSLGVALDVIADARHFFLY